MSEWSPLCFSLMSRALRCVTQDVLSSPVSLDPAVKGCTEEVISTEITTPAPDSSGRRRVDGGWGVCVCVCMGGGASGPAYITVTVGNHIHQIKSSIYLCGSGDSGGGRGDCEGGGPGVRE